MAESWVLPAFSGWVGQTWPAEVRPPRAVVGLVHGLGEHSGRYPQLVAALNAAGFAVTAVDLPGHGRSAGKRGHIPDYEQALDALVAFAAFSRQQFDSQPFFFYGHSLGGNLVANVVLRRDVAGLQGAVISSPWLRLAFEPPAYKVWLARTVGRWLPGLLQPNGLDPADLSRDPAVGEAYARDPLVHDRISAALFLSAYEAGLWALTHAGQLRVPVLLMHGTADRLTSPEASREFCRRAGEPCTLRLWEGFYHEVHHEIGRDAVYRAVLDWLNERLEG